MFSSKLLAVFVGCPGVFVGRSCCIVVGHFSRCFSQPFSRFMFAVLVSCSSRPYFHSAILFLDVDSFDFTFLPPISN